MAPKKVVKKKSPEEKIPVFTWGFKSSSTPLVGGMTFDYVAQLNQDGTVSCNCPGWRFVKKGQPRRCKHTDAVKGEVPDIMKSWRSGEKFEVQEYTAPQSKSPSVSSLPSDTTSVKKLKTPSNSTIRFNRVIEI